MVGAVQYATNVAQDHVEAFAEGGILGVGGEAHINSSGAGVSAGGEAGTDLVSATAGVGVVFSKPAPSAQAGHVEIPITRLGPVKLNARVSMARESTSVTVTGVALTASVGKGLDFKVGGGASIGPRTRCAGTGCSDNKEH